MSRNNKCIAILYLFLFFSKTIHPEAWRETHYRAVPYMMGIVTGCFMINCRKNISVPNDYIRNVLTLFGWAVAIYFLCIPYYFWKPLYLEYDAHRDAWAASFCWIIFACHQLNSGGILRIFLSLPFWEPLSKICLSVYLIHFPYMLIADANRKENVWIDAWWKISIYVGDIVVSIFLGTLLYLCVEIPFFKITQIILDQRIDFICKFLLLKFGTWKKNYFEGPSYERVPLVAKV